MTTRISMLAIDLAKGSFQVCAIGADGAVLYNRVLSRPRLMTLLLEQPACVVAMEACATSHHWGRVAQSHGHEVRLVPASYVKPFVKRQKNDKVDPWQQRGDSREGAGKRERNAGGPSRQNRTPQERR